MYYKIHEMLIADDYPIQREKESDKERDKEKESEIERGKRLCTAYTVRRTVYGVLPQNIQGSVWTLDVSPIVNGEILQWSVKRVTHAFENGYCISRHDVLVT